MSEPRHCRQDVAADLDRLSRHEASPRPATALHARDRVSVLGWRSRRLDLSRPHRHGASAHEAVTSIAPRPGGRSAVDVGRSSPRGRHRGGDRWTVADGLAEQRYAGAMRPCQPRLLDSVVNSTDQVDDAPLLGEGREVDLDGGELARADSPSALDGACRTAPVSAPRNPSAADEC